MNRLASESEATLLLDASRIFPGGVLGRHKLSERHALVFDHGSASHIFDASGREYIDFTCAGGAILLGYDDLRIIAAVNQQAAKALHFISILNEPAVRYAADLLDVIPCGDLLRFCCSGSEATFYAIRLARAFTGRSRILKFDGAYHGHHDYAMWSYNRARDVDYPAPIANTAGMPEGLRENILVAPYADVEATARIVAEYGSSIACIIVEPVQRMVAPPHGYLAALRRLCDEWDIVLIFDETVTGFRLALGGAQERYGVIPDVAVYGKSLGGGLPLACVAGREEILSLCDPARWNAADPRGVYFSGTLYGNPVACAAGRAFLKAIRERGVYDMFFTRSEMLKRGLGEIVTRRAIDALVLGEGPMWHLVFGADPKKLHSPSGIGDRDRLLRFHYGLIEEGIFVRPGGGMYISMALTDEDVEQTLSAADRVLAKI